MTPTEIAFLLNKNDIKWRQGTELKNIEPDQVSQVLQEAHSALRDIPDTGDSAVYYERGGLIVRKFHSHIDIFIYAGEIK